MPSDQDLEIKLTSELRSQREIDREHIAALRAETAQQQERIAFLERIVTQMIHTAYNAPSPAQVVPPSCGPVPRGTDPVCAACHRPIDRGVIVRSTGEIICQNCSSLRNHHSQPSTHH